MPQSEFLRLFYLILDNLHHFERPEGSSSLYHIKLDFPYQKLENLTFEQIRDLESHMTTNVKFHRTLKYNNYGQIYAHILKNYIIKSENCDIVDLV